MSSSILSRKLNRVLFEVDTHYLSFSRQMDTNLGCISSHSGVELPIRLANGSCVLQIIDVPCQAIYHPRTTCLLGLIFKAYDLLESLSIANNLFYLSLCIQIDKLSCQICTIFQAPLAERRNEFGCLLNNDWLTSDGLQEGAKRWKEGDR